MILRVSLQRVGDRSGIYPEDEAAVVSVLEALSLRHDLHQQRAMHRERRDGGEQPAVV